MEKNSFYCEKTGKVIEYLDFEMMRKEHPNGKINVVGEIDVNDSENIAKIKKLRDKDEEIAVQPLGKYKRSRYKTLGYIPCEYGEYVLVKQKRSRKGIIGLLLTLLIVCTLIGGLFLMNQGNKPDIDPNAGDYTSALKRPENIGESKILIPGYGKFEIQKNSDTINTVLFNPEENPCYFKFTLTEKATKEVIYESKLVPPGQGITPVKIKKTYDKVGVHDLILSFQTFDLEDTDIKYNGSNIDVPLNVVE